MAGQLFDLHTGYHEYYPEYGIDEWWDDPAITNGGSYALEDGDTIRTPYGSDGLSIALRGSGNNVQLGFSYDINGNHGLGKGNKNLSIIGDSGNSIVDLRGSNTDKTTLYVIQRHGGSVPSWYNHDEKGALINSSISLGHGNNRINLLSRGIVARNSSIDIGDGVNEICISSNSTPYGYGDEVILVENSVITLGNGGNRILLYATASIFAGINLPIPEYNPLCLSNSTLKTGAGGDTLEFLFSSIIAKDSLIDLGAGNDIILIQGDPFDRYSKIGESLNSTINMGAGVDKIICATWVNTPYNQNEYQSIIDTFKQGIKEQFSKGTIFGFSLKEASLEKVELQGTYDEYIVDPLSEWGVRWETKTITLASIDVPQEFSSEAPSGNGTVAAIIGNGAFNEGVILTAGAVSADPDGMAANPN